ncbi:CHAT domain-containing protein [Streptomyces sp. NPDC014991]|uniref:CHAT domain-containing protein n=1 Tax=Streptomyces sp. NPDC014991 TaxID=3364935 RepID=UPI0036F921B1
MSETRAVSAADRAAAVLARTAGVSVPFDPESYQGVRGPELDALTDDLDSVLEELTDGNGEAATAATVAARLGRCLALRFVLADAPGDRERALRLLESARTSVTLGAEDREAARRDLVTLLGSRMVRLNREAPAGLDATPTIDQLGYLFTVGAPLTHGGSGLVEDTGLLVRLLLEREHDGMTPELRDRLRSVGELSEALVGGETETVVQLARNMAGTLHSEALPPSLGTLLPLLLRLMEQSLGTLPPQPEGTGDPPADGPDDFDEVRDTLAQFLAMAEVMAPGTLPPQDLPGLLADLSQGRAAPAGEDGRAPLPSRMVAALFHTAHATRTGDMEGFREALRLMHEASADGELDSRVQREWLRTVVPGLLVGASLAGGSLQDEDMALALLEAQRWDDDPSSGLAATLRLCGEAARLHARLTSALDRGDDAAVEDVIDALCELELDETYDGAEDWTGALTGYVLGSACLGRVVLATSADDRNTHLRAAVHHLERAVETSVDMPALRGLLDITWAPLITLTAIAESDPGRIAEGVRRARAALDSPGFAADFRPRARGGIAIALDTLHVFTGDPGALDEAIAELTQALTELPEGGPGGARLTWDLAELRAKRAALRADAPEADGELRAAVGLARTSLRLAADDVLLQQGVGRGLRIARATAHRGRRAAFWALRAGRAEEAIGCLEEGRSLVLGAAAVSAGVADRLAAAGESALAEQWRSATAGPSWEQGDDRPPRDPSADAGPDALAGLRDRSPLEVLAAAGAGAPGLPGDLRRRSLDVLRGQDGADARPVSASVDDLRAGLRDTGADALLYLVPGVDGPDGAVLVVTPDGPAEALPLPGLTPAGREPVAEYLAAGAHLQSLEAAGDDAAADPGERERAEQCRPRALDGLCVWAGEVLGPVLDHLGLWDRALTEAGLAGTPGGTAPPDAVRLVLVPCGDLGVVPWQAAVLRPPAGYGVPRAVRACEVAVLTHAASGREFLRAAARRRMAPAGRPALVFHGGADLEWAEEEIDTLAAVLYPRAVVHRPDADPATPGTVLALLGGRAAAPASLVHIACHGLAGPDPTRSALRLAVPADAGEPPGTGGDLTLSTLLETPAEGDAFRSAGPLVVCGGCETDLTTRDHDEALTVTSVMVHRLATDAIGTRWRVDDGQSEVLMLVLHDALARGLAPPDALRAAQRWMLTLPGDRPPVRTLRDIPARRLAEDVRDRPDTWAAFVHHGNPAPAATPAGRQEGADV